MTSLQRFIEDHIMLIDASKWTELFQVAYEELKEEDAAELMKMLKDIDLPLDALQWGAIEGEILARIDYELTHKDPTDPANSWSRVRWMLYGISTYNYPYGRIVQHLIDNKDRLKLRMEPIADIYSYDGGDEYDLGWFNAAYYKGDE